MARFSRDGNGVLESDQRLWSDESVVICLGICSGRTSNGHLFGHSGQYWNCGSKLIASMQGTRDRIDSLYQELQGVHDKCTLSFPQSLEDFPEKEQCLSQLKEELGVQTEYVKRIGILAIDDLQHYVGSSSLHNHLVKEVHQAAVAEVQSIKAELGKNVTSQKILFPAAANIVIRHTGVWYSYIAQEEKKAAAVAGTPAGLGFSLPAAIPATAVGSIPSSPALAKSLTSPIPSSQVEAASAIGSSVSSQAASAAINLGDPLPAEAHAQK